MISMSFLQAKTSEKTEGLLCSMKKLFAVLLIFISLGALAVAQSAGERVIGNGESGLFKVEITSRSNVPDSIALSVEQLPKGVEASVEPRVLNILPSETRTANVNLKVDEKVQPGSYTVLLVGRPSSGRAVSASTARAAVERPVYASEGTLTTDVLNVQLDSMELPIEPASIRLKVAGQIFTLNDPFVRFEPRSDGGMLQFAAPPGLQIGKSFVAEMLFEDTEGNQFEFNADLRPEADLEAREREVPKVKDMVSDEEEILYVGLSKFPKKVDEDSIRFIVNGKEFDEDDRDVSLQFKDDDIVFALEKEFKDREELDVKVEFDDQEGNNKYTLAFKQTVGDTQLRDFSISVKIDRDELDDDLKKNSVKFVFQRDDFDEQDSELTIDTKDNIVTFKPKDPLQGGRSYDFILDAKDEDDDHFRTAGHFSIFLQQFEEVSDKLVTEIVTKGERDISQLYVEFDDFENGVEEDSAVIDLDGRQFDVRDAEFDVKFNDPEDLLQILFTDNRFRPDDRVNVRVRFEDDRRNEYEMTFFFNASEDTINDFKMFIRVDQLGHDMLQDSIRVNVDGELFNVEDSEIDADLRKNEIEYIQLKPLKFGDRMRFVIEAKDRNQNTAFIKFALTLDFDKQLEGARKDLEKQIDELFRRATMKKIIDTELSHQVENLEIRVFPAALGTDIVESRTEVKFNGTVYDRETDELFIKDDAIKFKSREGHSLGEKFAFEAKSENTRGDSFKGKLGLKLDFERAVQVQLSQPSAETAEMPSVSGAVLQIPIEFRVERLNLFSDGIEITGYPVEIALAASESKKIAFSVNNLTNETLRNVQIKLHGVSTDIVFEPVKIEEMKPHESRTIVTTISATSKAKGKSYPIVLEATSDKYKATASVQFSTAAKKSEGTGSPLAAFATFVKTRDGFTTAVLALLVVVVAATLKLLLSKSSESTAQEAWMSQRS